MEIIGNIKKQKDEIDKILQDTKELQRKTNVLFGTLDRVFTVVDETIFRVRLSLVESYSLKSMWPSLMAVCARFI